MGISSEKYIIEQFHHCVNITECTTHPWTVQPTAHQGCLVQPIAPALQTSTASYCTQACQTCGQQAVCREFDMLAVPHEIKQAQEKSMQCRDTGWMRLLPG